MALIDSSIDAASQKIYIILSQFSVKEEWRENILYIIDLKTSSVKKHPIKLNGLKSAIIMNCTLTKNKIIFMDYDLNLYQGDI